MKCVSGLIDLDTQTLISDTTFNMEDIIKKIKDLTQKKNAVILSHVYQEPEIQDIADFVGDSLGLSMEASKTNADIIVFCGVNFMAETAKILSPQKKVFLPDLKANCPMADMVNMEDVLKEKEKYPNAVVVSYVNTTAEVKSVTDICCTSANAVKICKTIPDKEIIFVPDMHLGAYVEKQVPEKIFHLWPGFCNTHSRILPEHIDAAKREHPDAIVIAHPECRMAVLNKSDFVGSTSQMQKFAKGTNHKEIIVGTEIGLIYTLKKANPEKSFYPVAPENILTCPTMKYSTLEKVLYVLETEDNEILLNKDIIKNAKKCVEVMIKII